MESGLLNGSLSEGEDDDVEPMTSAEVLAKLEQAWLNEKHAPDILEHKSEFVDCVFELIHQMEENIKNIPPHDFRVLIHKMEMDRIRYIVNCYLRCRFEKIQKYTAHVLKLHKEMGSEGALLTSEEFEFANDYISSIQNHLSDIALQHIPGHLRSLDLNATMPKPQTSEFVFFKVLEDINEILLDEDVAENVESVVNLKVNSQHITKYKSIVSLVKAGSIHLI